MANQCCPDRRQGSCSLIRQSEQNENSSYKIISALLDTDRSHKTALTADEKRYLAVYIY
ncbi:unnamed protein product [Staurois parvus]|uniref:Uncharacterized protein n=1 Tax=Staurois parvus TaxID=386267 RepID=A0ABN9D9I5_9NEOB|nr:unnamed protein product [Staurois parvus]